LPVPALPITRNLKRKSEQSEPKSRIPTGRERSGNKIENKELGEKLTQAETANYSNRLLFFFLYWQCWGLNPRLCTC
jgi:hypothetical protein